MKKITTISFILFIGTFMVLALVLPPKEPELNYQLVEVEQDTVKEVSVVENKITTITKPNTNTGSNTTTTTTPTTATKPVLNSTEVAKHNIASDCYLIVRDKVYDVSTYINKHPGGKKKIINTCGEEVSSLFASIHSNFAWNLLSKYYVGPLVN